MERKVTLREVETFLAVCRTGGFLKAGKILGTTQANVSKIIARMEKHLGVQLFARVQTGARLTPDGEYVRPYAEQIEHIADMIRAVKEEKTEAIYR